MKHVYETCDQKLAVEHAATRASASTRTCMSSILAIIKGDDVILSG